eukprot:scaffold85517_cov32-Tisochrysis_lutea.AAC.7
MPVIDPPRRFPAQILVPLSASQFATPQGNSRMRASSSRTPLRAVDERSLLLSLFCPDLVRMLFPSLPLSPQPLPSCLSMTSGQHPSRSLALTLRPTCGGSGGGERVE